MKLECPYCGERVITVLGKIMLSPLRREKCHHCGKMFSIGWNHLLYISIGFLLAGLYHELFLPDFNIGLILLLVCLLWLPVYLFFVPLSPRE